MPVRIDLDPQPGQMPLVVLTVEGPGRYFGKPGVFENGDHYVYLYVFGQGRYGPVSVSCTNEKAVVSDTELKHPGRQQCVGIGGQNLVVELV